MNWSLRFAYFELLYILLPLICCAIWYRWKVYKAPVYIYSLANQLRRQGLVAHSLSRFFFPVCRVITLVGLAFLIARPQLVDEKSKVMVEGIDIMLVLDVSGSMQCFDDPHEKKQRIEIAKEEAIKFIKKRDNDPIGLVLFGREAASRCPLTLDKKVLESIIADIELGVLAPDGTVLAKGLITALNRFKNSKAKAKIIILLTDGDPTPGDLHPDDAITLARKYGVKIYTIGIGGKYGGLIEHPGFGVQQVGAKLDTQLLDKLAVQTGGQSFLASNQQELKSIYDTIDQLEKTEYETDIFQSYQDIFMPFLWAVAGLLLLELLIATFVWFGL